jgi:hypothetical protein
MLKLYKNTGIQRFISLLYVLIFLFALYDMKARVSIFPSFLVDIAVYCGAVVLAFTENGWLGYLTYALVLSLTLFMVFNLSLLAIRWVYLGFSKNKNT